MSKGERGFTVTELIIGITVGSIVIGLMFSTMLNYYVKLLQAEVTTEMALESQAALTQLTEDIRLATSIGATNLINDPNAPGGGWTTSDANNVIVIDAPVVDSDRDIVYDDSTGFAYRNEYIYFISGTNMYKRVLKNTDAPGNAAIGTCPPASSTPACPADRLFGTKVAGFSFTLLDSSNNTTAVASEARAILFTVDMQKTVFSKNLSLSNSTRVTFRNQ